MNGLSSYDSRPLPASLLSGCPTTTAPDRSTTERLCYITLFGHIQGVLRIQGLGLGIEVPRVWGGLWGVTPSPLGEGSEEGLFPRFFYIFGSRDAYFGAFNVQ